MILVAMLCGGAIFLGLYLAFGIIVPRALGAILFALVCYGAWSDWRRAYKLAHRPRDARGRFVTRPTR